MKKSGIVGIIVFFALIILVIPSVAASQPQTGHPYMLFHDISEIPGYHYRTIEPWKGWESSIMASANTSLSRNFSENLGYYDSVDFRGSNARDLGMAYQITKKSQYAMKARAALLNMDVGSIGSDDYAKSNKARALAGYSLAYDWIQPTLDPASDIMIQDKLALFADTVYKDLNDNGTRLNDVSFSQQGQSYATMGVVSAVLYDYTNPNNQSLSSTPTTWHRVGREYLFENDLLHSYGKSLFSWGFDEASGKYLNGAYKSYTMDDLALWFQVSNHVYGENLLDIYPAAKKAFTAEIGDSLPNDYSDNYVTNGNTKWMYHKAIVSLLPDNEKSTVLNHLDRIEKSTLLPYSSIMGGSSQGGISSALYYCVYGNYAAIPRSFPATTSHLDPKAVTQLFRESWNDDADWLSLITYNKNTRSNRDMQHHDQLSFEYYSRGDLLLADGGEEKVVLDKFYGTGVTYHNTIAIENPRSPFPESPYTGSAALGVYKGDAGGLVTPPTVDTVIEVPWMQAVQSHVTITKVSNDTTLYAKQSLTSPIQYTRAILYPASDYFIIVDRMEGSEAWRYNNLFRPTSLMITKTIDANGDGVWAESEVGHVNGDLSIGSTPFNWQALPFKKETPTGKTTNTISWATKNPYGKDVKLDLVSAPASEILVTKHVGRIGGSGSENEVFNPVVYFRSPAVTSEYRVTALLSRYSTETAKTATEIAVTGTGHAIKVSSASSVDYIYTGKGTSSFAGFTTDADTVFVRKQGSNIEYTLLQGSLLMDQNDPWVIMTKRADAITANRVNGSIDYRIQGEPDLQGDIFQQHVDSNKIEKRINSNEQQKSNEPQKPMVKSNTNAVPEETGDIIRFLKNLIKSVLSFVTSNTMRG